MPRITGLLKIVLLGREHGLRARLRRRVGLGRAPEAPPAPTEVVTPSREAPKAVTPPEGFEVVLHKDALAPGQITEVIVAGTAVAVANVGGAFHAMSNVCPHAGGPIGDGTMDGHKVTCPYHGWSFDVRDGRCFVNEDVNLPLHEVRVVGDAVCVRL